MKNILLVSVLLLAPIANAVVLESGGRQVTKLRVNAEGVYVTFYPAPPQCKSGNDFKANALLSKGHENYDALVSSLVALKTTKTKLSGVWFSNEDVKCGDAGILGLEGLEF